MFGFSGTSLLRLILLTVIFFFKFDIANLKKCGRDYQIPQKTNLNWLLKFNCDIIVIVVDSAFSSV